MIKNIKNAKIISLKVEQNSCSLGFFIDFVDSLKKEALLLSFDNHLSIQESIKLIKPNFKEFESLEISYLFFKNEFFKLLDRYDKEIFKKELHSLAFEEYKIVYLHRVDLFPKGIESELQSFITTLLHKDIKVIFSAKGKTDFDRYSDLQLDILYEDNRCILEDKSKKQNRDIALISNQKESIELTQKLFQDQKNISLKVIKLEELHSIDRAYLSTLDMIIYHDNRRVLDKAMTESLKTVSPNSKIHYITEKEAIREEDLRAFKELGVDRVYPKNFDIKRYIYDLEDALEENFYTKKLNNLNLKKHSCNRYEDFLNRVELLEKNGIIFTMVSLNVDDINGSFTLRDGDFLYHDKSDDMVVVAIMHLSLRGVKDTLSKRFGIDKSLIKEYKKDILSRLVADA